MSIAGVTMSTPSHALEHLQPTAQDAMAQFDAKAQGVQASMPDGAGMLHTIHGHVCAAHCAAHVVSAPPEAQPFSHPQLTLADWPKPVEANVSAGRIFALERPPRA